MADVKTINDRDRVARDDAFQLPSQPTTKPGMSERPRNSGTDATVYQLLTVHGIDTMGPRSQN